MADKQRYNYPGEQIDVSWDEALCIHIGECGRAQGELFVGGRQPWCQPDRVSVDDAVEVVRRCPSGALSFTRKDGGPQERAEEENTVTVAYKGPLYLRGDLDIEGLPADVSAAAPGLRFRAALCRCGQSKNKPFCDNSHESVAFDDYGAVGERGPGATGKGGKLRVQAAPNGPLLLSGNCTIIAASGRRAWQGNDVALCRCGHSRNKPFCDGSHKAAGFTSD